MNFFTIKSKAGKHKIEVIEGKRPFKLKEFIHITLVKIKLAKHKWVRNYTSNWDTDFDSCKICGTYKDK